MNDVQDYLRKMILGDLYHECQITNDISVDKLKKRLAKVQNTLNCKIEDLEQLCKKGKLPNCVHEFLLNFTVTHKIDETYNVNACLIYQGVNTKIINIAKFCLINVDFTIGNQVINLTNGEKEIFPIWIKLNAFYNHLSSSLKSDKIPLRGGGHSILCFSLREMLEREMIKETDVIYLEAYDKERLRETKENDVQSRLVNYYESLGFVMMYPSFKNDYIRMDEPIPMWSTVNKILTRCKKDSFNLARIYLNVNYEEY